MTQNLFAEAPVVYKGRFRPLAAYAHGEKESLEHLWKIHFANPSSEFNPTRALQGQLWGAGETFKMLPSKYRSGEWVSLKALEWPVGNLTVYSDQEFEKIRGDYLALKSDPGNKLLQEKLLQTLSTSYQQIEGTVYLQGDHSALRYPSQWQLKAEILYVGFPWLHVTVALYGIACLLFVLVGGYPPWKRGALFLMGSAFTIHTIFLFLRSYILERPPVANMAETMIYVPWIAVALSFIFSRSLLSLICGSLIGGALLIILNITLEPSLENVQAVLNSQYWLTIHVLMVVASYGVFLLGGVLAHFYMLGYGQKELGAILLQTFYIGLALLIPGTILGGVWAAESWGRFWDWDPKEAWAFISICVYLLVIHAYRFHRIGFDGLAVGAVLGLQAIIFTWYGVNYILGTGLHTYGFGSGGERFYYLTFLIELGFIGWFFAKKSRLSLTSIESAQLKQKGEYEKPSPTNCQ